MSTQQTREGFALFVVIIGVLALSTLTMTALDMGVQEARSARAVRVSASALYTADTGVEIVRASWPTTPISPGASLDLGWTSLANGSRYRPVIQRRDAGLGKMQIYSLTVEGWSPGPLGGQATVQVWATRFYLTGRFTGAISAKGNVTLNGTPTTVDSYDSRLGDYNAPLEGGSNNVGEEGDVQANGSISLTGYAQIEGDVTTSTSSVNDPHSGIAGTVTLNAPAELYPVETCPDYTESMPGNVYSNHVFWVSSQTYTIPGGTYSFHDFVMRGGAIVVIPPGESVKIYLSGMLDMGGNTLIENEGHSAAALSFVACNRGGTPNTTNWTLHGGSGAYFTVYAPNNNVKLAGDSPVFGAIVANNFTAVGGAAVHYDVALGAVQQSPDSVSAIMPRSWRQLLR